MKIFQKFSEKFKKIFDWSSVASNSSTTSNPEKTTWREVEAYEIAKPLLKEIIPDKEKKLPRSRGIRVRSMKNILLYSFPPYTWERIGIFLYKDFMNAGLPFPTVTDDDYLPYELIEKIDETLRSFFGKGLPKESKVL